MQITLSYRVFYCKALFRHFETGLSFARSGVAAIIAYWKTAHFIGGLTHGLRSDTAFSGLRELARELS